MPQTINGVGTHYYGRSNDDVRVAVCNHCHRETHLHSYETRLYFVVLFIPIVPLARKRIIDYCSLCTYHYAVDPEQYEMSRQLNTSGAEEEYLKKPGRETALALHGTLLGYRNFDDAAALRDAAREQFPGDAELLTGFACHLESMNQHAAATPYWQDALALAPASTDARTAVALRHMQDGRPDEARRLLDHLEEPGAGKVYPLGPIDLLAGVYQAQGNHQAALDICDVLLREFPENGRNRKFRAFVQKSEKALATQTTILPPQKHSLFGLLDLRDPQYSGWTRALVLGGIVFVLGWIGAVFSNRYIRTHRTVHLFNATKLDCQYSIDGGPARTLAQNAKVTLAEGPHVVRFMGERIEDIPFEVKTGYFERWTSSPVWILNVRGARAFIERRITYAVNPRPSESEVYINERVIYRPHADYLFTEPPHTLKLDNKSSEVRKIQFTYLDLPLDSIFYYLSQTKPGEAHAWAEDVLLRENDSDLWEAYANSMSEPPRLAEYDKFLLEGIELAPPRVEFHRRYQDRLESQGRNAELLERYGRLLAAAPRDAVRLYLRGRVESDAERAHEYFIQASEADPNLGWPWFALAYAATARGEWQESVDLMTKAAGVPESQKEGLRHTAFLALGRGAELEPKYRKQLADNPSDLRALTLLCDVLMSRNERAPAEQAIRTSFASLQSMASSAPEIYHAMHAATLYVVGDFQGMEQDCPVDSQGAQQGLRAHLLATTDRPDVAVAETGLATALDDSGLSLMLSLAFALQGDEARATEWQTKGIQKLSEGSPDERAVAALLGAADPPDFERVARLAIRLGDKALYLAILGYKFPGLRQDAYGLARKLNVSRTPPYHVLAKFLSSAP